MKNIFASFKTVLFDIDFSSAIASGIEEFNRLSGNRPIVLDDIDDPPTGDETGYLNHQLVLPINDEPVAV